jgi:hypothetical protein
MMRRGGVVAIAAIAITPSRYLALSGLWLDIQCETAGNFDPGFSGLNVPEIFSTQKFPD